jgi:hypothetical protein
MRKSKIDPAGREIIRLWGDCPVVDALKDLRIFILPEDLEKAKPKDPAYCVFARACRRTFKSRKVLFYRTVAYVEMPTEDGSRVVERFMMPPSMRQLVESFDRGKPTIPEAGFVLLAPQPSAQFGNRQHRKILEKEQKQQRLEGTNTGKIGNRGKGKYEDEPIAIDLLSGVRSGVGMVHFAHKRKSEDTNDR